jgi:hypothetical protein
VLVDVRNVDNKKDTLLGDWEGCYQLGMVASKEVDEIAETP